LSLSFALAFFSVALRFASSGQLVNSEFPRDFSLSFNGRPVSATAFLISSIGSMVSVSFYLLFFFKESHNEVPHKLWGLGLVSLRYRDFETDKILKRRGCLPAILALHVTAFTSLCLCNWLAV
jgi:hypothetical protein